MNHPNQATLALHAGGDLGFIARWRTQRHVSKCERCRNEVAQFGAIRDIAADLAEIPEVPWNRLAAEMKANIRLGLAAGACVRVGETPLRETPVFTRTRAAVALASVLALLVTGIMLDRPAPIAMVVPDDSMVLQQTANGIQVGRGDRAFLLLNAADAQNVTFSVNAQGSMGARYVDPKTGLVTMNSVYAE
jgi:hypothetical protein